jgi:hypothetical protein
MADLAASDITVTPEEMDFMTFNKVAMAKIKFGDGALTIPAGGIPLPDLVSFGLHKGIKRAIADHVGGYVFRVDRANHKLMVFYADNDAVANGPLIEATGVAIAEIEVELTLIGQ